MTSKANGKPVIYLSMETKARLIDFAWDLRRKEPGIKVTYDLAVSRLLTLWASRTGSSGNEQAGLDALRTVRSGKVGEA